MVSAAELARRLEVSPEALRAWLRGHACVGHPLLSGHRRYGRWEFTAKQAERLAREYRRERRLPKIKQRAGRRSSDEAAPDTATRPAAEAGHRVVEKWRGEAVETLEDVLAPKLRAVCIGINPSPVSVGAGHYYQGRLGQLFFERLRRVGLLPEPTEGYEDDALFAAGVGFTDIVKRPTPREKDLSPADFEHGRQHLVEKLERYRPKLALFTFKKTATKLFGSFEGNGYQPRLSIGGAKVFVMPGPYDASEQVAARLRSLRRLVRTLPRPRPER